MEYFTKMGTKWCNYNPDIRSIAILLLVLFPLTHICGSPSCTSLYSIQL